MQRYLKLVVVGMVLILAGSSFAHAQGCVLCYQNAAASGARIIAALRSGIEILIVPPFVIMGLAMRMAYRKRNQYRGESPQS